VTVGLQQRATTPSTASLPDDLLREQLLRVQLLYLAGAVLWSITCALDLWIAPNGDRGPYGPMIDAAAALLAVAAIVYVRYAAASDRSKLAVGSALVVAHALAIGLVNSWTPQPITSRPISGITLLVLLFGMIAPTSPRRMVTIALISATMDPVCVWLAHVRGLPVPSVSHTFVMFYLNYACALIAVVPSSIVYRLGREVKDARALGSYELIEPLGKGGMGEVWIGRHRLLARNAAIKVIRPEILSGRRRDEAITTLRRFELEAKATAAMTSPHTIRVFDCGLTRDGTFYYVMELLDGRDLETLVRDVGPLPPARVTHILRQICSSLIEAHGFGLIHRDIKPANVFTCRMGVDYDVVKVLDFGLVKHEDRASAPTIMTSGPMTIGTPAYMAPEAILGDVALDRRVDIYALGCVAYFLLTGTQVFDAPSPMKLLMQHVSAAPLPPSRRAAGIPPALDRLVMACLHKDPDRRPSRVEDILEMLPSSELTGEWTPAMARAWWESKLPQLSRPASSFNQSRASASEYRADDVSGRALLRPSIY
jgi:serine/threonine protein kinase